jgi:hypothetical protein
MPSDNNATRYDRTTTAVNYVLDRTVALRVKYPDLREGQALMTVIGKVDPDLYSAIVGTDNDIFYTADHNTDKLADFVDFLVTHYQSQAAWRD